VASDLRDRIGKEREAEHRDAATTTAILSTYRICALCYYCEGACLSVAVTFSFRAEELTYLTQRTESLLQRLRKYKCMSGRLQKISQLLFILRLLEISSPQME
jgi:nitroimidazol reductase NimA-like FMN-containing flavoprotein (pyridoxamine 5'-phosphate oxidase superfamily)